MIDRCRYSKKWTFRYILVSPKITFQILFFVLCEVFRHRCSLLENTTFKLNIFLKKIAIPGLFYVDFRLSKQTLQFLQQMNVKKYPSSIWCSYWNTRPSVLESPPITTRLGLPPKTWTILYTVVITNTRQVKSREYRKCEKLCCAFWSQRQNKFQQKCSTVK